MLTLTHTKQGGRQYDAKQKRQDFYNGLPNQYEEAR